MLSESLSIKHPKEANKTVSVKEPIKMTVLFLITGLSERF